MTILRTVKNIKFTDAQYVFQMMSSTSILGIDGLEMTLDKKNLKGWNYFMSEKFQKNARDLGLSGKYLFFHTNPEVLEKIAIDEIENNGFDVAKISAELGKQPDYVLCLYSQNDSRKDELAEKYQGKNGIEYKYWKSEEDTRKRKYSKQYLDNL